MLEDLYHFAGNVQEEILKLQVEEETQVTADIICETFDLCF
ncbi:hypothetical protein PVK73_25690 [Bacillus thuringiensis]